MEKNLDIIWPKRISVDKRIVKILSESTYENFPDSIKEIITNCYDADASEVKININIEKEVITIIDNGKGMSAFEFDFFLRIAGIKREMDKATSQLGRFQIGKFGVGFLSIFPYFKNYNIESTKKGSNKILIANVPCYKYFSSGSLAEVSEIPIEGHISINNDVIKQSYTKITLSGFTELANAFFKPVTDISHRKNSIFNYIGIKKLIWRLEEDLPLEYEDDRFNILLKKYSPTIPFRVYINEMELRRRMYAKQILEINGHALPFQNVYDRNFELNINDLDIITIGKIKFQYFILSDQKAVSPVEARGVKKRNLNVGVGKRTFFELGSEVKGNRSRLHWLTGEILIIEGLNDLINVNRSDFYYDFDYEKLKEFFIEKLSYHSNLLEKEADYLNESNDTKIKHLKFIQEIPIKLKYEAYTPDIFTENNNDNTENEKIVENTKDSIILNNSVVTKNTIISKNSKIDKKIEVFENIYSVKVSKWKYKNENFPACRIEGNILIVNESYPLFKGVKYTDIFIRLHLMLLLNLKNGIIDQKTYIKMLSDVSEIFKNY